MAEVIVQKMDAQTARIDQLEADRKNDREVVTCLMNDTAKANTELRSQLEAESSRLSAVEKELSAVRRHGFH